MTETVATLLTQVVGAVTGFVPNLEIFIGAGAVAGLAIMVLRRVIKAGR